MFREGVAHRDEGESSGAERRLSPLRCARGQLGGPSKPGPRDSVYKCAAPTTEWSAPQGTSERRAKGLPRERTTAAPRQVDAGPSCRTPRRASLRLRRPDHQLPRRVPAPRRGACLDLLVLSLGRSRELRPARRWPSPRLRAAVRRRATRPGGGANSRTTGRDCFGTCADTKSRAAWTRPLHEHPNARKYKGGNKKGLSKGCFGLKLDRIGSMSGLGC